MDTTIWQNLPPELIRKIIEASEPSIDVQLCFKIPPKKIPEARTWRLWYLLKSHDGLIYNLESKSLHIFRMPGHHVVRRPYELSYIDQMMTCFNEDAKDHEVEMTCPDGSYIVEPGHHEPFYTELRVLLRGSGLARVLNVSGSTF
jgi:hypothetical protein